MIRSVTIDINIWHIKYNTEEVLETVLRHNKELAESSREDLDKESWRNIEVYESINDGETAPLFC